MLISTNLAALVQLIMYNSVSKHIKLYIYIHTLHLSYYNMLYSKLELDTSTLNIEYMLLMN